MVWPVSILQMPHCPLLPREKMLDLQTSGRVAAGVCAELSCHLELPVSG